MTKCFFSSGNIRDINHCISVEVKFVLVDILFNYEYPKTGLTECFICLDKTLSCQCGVYYRI